MPNVSQSVLGNYRTAPAAAIGGDVIALMLRAKARPKPNLPYSGAYSQPTYMMAGIIPVTSRMQEQYTFDSEVTQNAVEDGSVMSDHVILRPVRVDLVFEVNNIPDSSAAKSILEQMSDMWQSRQRVDLLTEHSQVSGMVCRGIQAVNESPTWGKLTFRASFQQVAMITLASSAFTKSKTTATAKTGGPNRGKSAQSKTQNGVKKPTAKKLPTSNTSVVSKIKNTLFPTSSSAGYAATWK